jgi:hypothetical protein
VIVNGLPVEDGGPGSPTARVDRTDNGVLYNAAASVSGLGNSNTVNGAADIGEVGAAANASDGGSDTHALGQASLDFFVRAVEFRPFPIALLALKLPITVSFTVTASGFGRGFGAAGSELVVDPGLGESITQSATIDLSIGSLFEVHQIATAFPFCPPQNAPKCDFSRAKVDPLFGFDQKAFDAEAAAAGLTSVPLAQFLKFDSSPNLDVLPPIPGGSSVPEPPTWALLIAGLGFLGVAQWLRRPGSARVSSNPPALDQR